MRTLKLQVQLSIDGFMAGPSGEMDWMVWDWDDSLKAYTTALTQSVDCIVMGQQFAQGFIPYWQSVSEDTAQPEQAAGKRFMEMEKVLFSQNPPAQPPAPEWPRTRASQHGLVEGINALKDEPGGDMIAYGGASFVRSLIAAQLIDDYFLYINPVCLGKGLSAFPVNEKRASLVLKEVHAFPCGIGVLHYSRKRGW